MDKMMDDMKRILQTGQNQLIVELFACMDSELSSFEAGSASLDLLHAISMTQARRLAPLTQVIPDPSLRVSHPMEVQLWCDGEQGPHMRASALVEHVCPAVVIPGEEEPELEAEPEPQPLIPEPSISEGPDEKYLIESLLQENRALYTELQSFKSKSQKVMKSFRERLCELEAEADSDHNCREYVQADALALEAGLDGLRLQ